MATVTPYSLAEIALICSGTVLVYIIAAGDNTDALN